ncbi:MAG: J domain-containing protein [Armatimonadetes bacterium]|nr:J domain-containing protein [Armatimonadota bacterium]
MSNSRRAYNLLRGYVNREVDRLHSLDLKSAWSELEQAMGRSGDAPTASSTGAAATGTNPESGAVQIEVESTSPESLAASARKILGVEPDAGFDAIRKAFEKMSRRSAPENFEAGTPEATQAEEILRKATWAYTYLTKEMTPAEKRFRSLEIE